MRVAITGINGFIGARLAVALKRRGHFVAGVDFQQSCKVEVDRYAAGSVLDKEGMARSLDGMDAVVHLAALTAHSDIVDNRFETLDINFQGTRNALEAFVKSAGGKFVYSSTGKVYGDIRSLPIDETHPAMPLNILGKSKLITERLIDFYADTTRSFTALRIFNVYGPGQKHNFLLPTILGQLTPQRPAGGYRVALGDIRAQRDYLFVDDVIGAFVAALESDMPHGFLAVNICSGIAVSAGEIVGRIAGILNTKIEIDVNERLVRPDEKDIEYGSYALAERLMGWKPRVSLDDGLRETLRSFGLGGAPAA